MSNRKRTHEDLHERSNYEPGNATWNPSTPSIESVLNTNFEELARKLPSFGVVWRSNSQLQAPEVRCALARALMSVHWGISTASIPLGHLAPPIPNRYFFVRWLLESVLPLTDDGSSQVHYGLDIGTGAYCVYPLLMVSSSPSIHMYATDIDTESLQFAQQHVNLNPHISPRIQLLHAQSSHRQSDCEGATEQIVVTLGPLKRSLDAINSKQQITFCMTNPPFYDMNESTNNISSMTFNEGHYPGGEAGFCIDIIMDGLSLYFLGGNTMPPPVWSSTMCGKKSSWTFLRNVLWQALGYSHVCATEFAPKNLMRWFLAWTFQSGIASLAQQVTWQFSIGSLSNAETEERIQAYCCSFPGGSLRCRQVRNELEITELRDNTIAWKGDSALPAQIRNLVANHPTKRNALLPAEGHFLLRLGLADGQVHADGRIHSPNGRAVIEKIRSQLQNEVCRTSRQWRRKLKR